MAMPLGFALAFSFHASNHVLWRINFFVAWCPALLALVAPAEQLSAAELVHAATADGGTARHLVPMAIVVVYLAMQLGHAMDLATEKLLAACRARLASALDDPTRLVSSMSWARDLGHGLIWLLEMHCLGDYYSSYWPTAHPLAATPVVCMVAVWPDGVECLLPAVVDYYWRRDMSSGVTWPRDANGECIVKRWEGWSDSKGNLGGLQAARGHVAVNAAMPAISRPVAEVLRALEVQLEETFLGFESIRRLEQSGAAKMLLRARVLQADGPTALRIQTLWEVPMKLRSLKSR